MLDTIIRRPVIIPALSEQLDQKQAEYLDQIIQFIQQYDSIAIAKAIAIT